MNMYDNPYHVTSTYKRSFNLTPYERAVADLVADPNWDNRPDKDQRDILERASGLELDIYTLRARGWKCSRMEAKTRLLTWVYGAKPGTFVDVRA